MFTKDSLYEKFTVIPNDDEVADNPKYFVLDYANDPAAKVALAAYAAATQETNPGLAADIRQALN